MEGWLPLRELLAPATTVSLLVTGLAVVWLTLGRTKSEATGRKNPASVHSRNKGNSGSPSSEDDASLPSLDVAADALRRPSLHGTLIPSTGLIIANPSEPYPFENPKCSGLFVTMHRPTMDVALDSSGDYPFGDHFQGRRRLWELRVQFTFKARVKGLLVGIELENYVPLNAAAKRLMGMTVTALRQVAGNDLYHSVGDDPTKGCGPHEKPVFMMPLWACDQMIVTPEGEKPPDLCDPNFSAYGMRRAEDRRTFVEEIGKLELTTGPTYSFCFWGISQFLDCIKWELTKIIPFKNIDFNMFCGRPPVHLVMYTLDDSSMTRDDRRHLEQRKNYYFRVALWSSVHRPSPEKMRELIPRANDLHMRAGAGGEIAQRKGLMSKLFACCVSGRTG